MEGCWLCSICRLHDQEHILDVVEEALNEAKLEAKDIDCIAYTKVVAHPYTRQTIDPDD